MMAVAISGFDDFMLKFDERKDRSDLFSFFLFDDRPDHQPVAGFVADHAGWLDQLASASRTFTFFFVPDIPQVTWEVDNPGLEVARIFDILPKDLPGIVIFCLDDDREGVRRGTYYPLEASRFENDLTAVQQTIADLFSMIQECMALELKPDEKLDELEARISARRRSERRRPFVQALKSQSQELLKLPSQLLLTMAEAFGKGLAGRLAG
jgi:hypothetical protein